MEQIYKLSHQELADFISNDLIREILEKEYPTTYSGKDILTALKMDLKRIHVSSGKFLKLKSSMKEGFTNE